MLEFFDIHTDMGCTLFPKILEIPHQMEYLTQLYEECAVSHEIMNLPIGNVIRILWTDPHRYLPLSTKTNLKEDTTGWKNNELVERVCIKYKQKNNIATHEYLIPNQIYNEVKALSRSLCVNNKYSQNLTSS